jgi:hypothetical protein
LRPDEPIEIIMSDTGRHGRDRRSFVPSPRGTAGRAAPELRPAVRTLDPVELVWLAEARELLRGPDVDLTDVAWLGGHVDELMTAWHHTMPSLRWDPLPTTTAVGLAVGDAVIARVTGLERVYALDSPGSPYALAHPRTTMVVLHVDAKPPPLTRQRRGARFANTHPAHARDRPGDGSHP